MIADALAILAEIDAATDRLRALFEGDHPTADAELSIMHQAIAGCRGWLLIGGRVEWDDPDPERGTCTGLALHCRGKRAIVQAPNGDTAYVPLADLRVAP